MDYVYSIFNNFKYYYDSMNPATLSGAIDVIVVEQPDGSLLSTPFHVRFGKWAVFNIDNKFVDIQINNETIDGIKMKLGDNGVAFFVEEIHGEEDFPEYLATSPIPGASADSDSEKADEPKKESPKKLRKRAGRKSGASSAQKAAAHKDQPSADHLKSKKRLPFSSSIFSLRKYRSLPDLSFIAKCEQDTAEKQPKSSARKHKGHKRKLTSTQIDQVDIEQANRPISQSKSAILRVHDQPARTAAAHGAGADRKVTFGTESDTEDEEDKQRKEKASIPRSISDLADGALSDSEVDRQRFEPPANEAEWKWGEYPESKPAKDKDAKSKKEKNEPKNRGGWSWFRWRSRNEPQEPTQEEGVYLGDLMNKDPKQVEKYFGTSCPSNSSNIDSGNGYSVGASPSSPSAMSMESLMEENVANAAASDALPEEETPTPQEVKTALLKADITEKQMLAGTADDQATTSAAPFTEEVEKNFERHQSALNRQKSPANRRPVLPPKTRSMSGTSMTSDVSSVDEEGGIYTSMDDGRRIRYKRTLRLQSDQLKALRLQYGSNDVRFSISTKIQGTAWCSCHIYLLKWHERIVISDIDGTITKSDVLGHIIPAIGGTWAHSDIVDLYSRIRNNGYRIVYLSSRAIGQSYQTKKYLASVIQDSKMLPDGPVLLSPTSVLMAFRKEVIERRPEEFKIACLTDLRSLFPVPEPFYAGFGNRETDIKSYAAVGIPMQRIFIIDPTGRVESASRFGFRTKYDAMSRDNIVDCYFAPLNEPEISHCQNEEDLEKTSKFFEPENYSDFTYWRSSPTKLEPAVDLELEKYEQDRQKRRAEEAKKKKTSGIMPFFSSG